MENKILNFDIKINSENANILLGIVNELQQMINYIKENIFIKKKEEEIYLEEKSQNAEDSFSLLNEDDKNEKTLKKDNKIKLGEKRKKSLTTEEKAHIYSEKEKENKKDFQRHFIEIINRIKNLMIKINKEYTNQLNQSKISIIYISNII